MTIQAAIREAGPGRAIQRQAWLQAGRRDVTDPDWALLWCPGGSPAIMPRQGIRVRYILTLEEVLAEDWQPVPWGAEGAAGDFVTRLREAEYAAG